MTYLDAHPFSGAFVANRLDRLTSLIFDQGDEMLRNAGVAIPSQSVSLLLLVGEHGGLCAADIASTLNQAHQLVTQRVEVLVDLGMIERKADPVDGRRRILVLTPKGKAKYATLQSILPQAANAFAELFDEIECDMSAFSLKAMEALGRVSILDRIRMRSPSYPAKAGDAHGCKV